MPGKPRFEKTAPECEEVLKDFKNCSDKIVQKWNEEVNYRLDSHLPHYEGEKLYTGIESGISFCSDTISNFRLYENGLAWPDKVLIGSNYKGVGGGSRGWDMFFRKCTPEDYLRIKQDSSKIRKFVEELTYLPPLFGELFMGDEYDRHWQYIAWMFKSEDKTFTHKLANTLVDIVTEEFNKTEPNIRSLINALSIVETVGQGHPEFKKLYPTLSAHLEASKTRYMNKDPGDRDLLGVHPPLGKDPFEKAFANNSWLYEKMLETLRVISPLEYDKLEGIVK